MFMPYLHLYPLEKSGITEKTSIWESQFQVLGAHHLLSPFNLQSVNSSQPFTLND